MRYQYNTNSFSVKSETKTGNTSGEIVHVFSLCTVLHHLVCCFYFRKHPAQQQTQHHTQGQIVVRQLNSLSD